MEVIYTHFRKISDEISSKMTENYKELNECYEQIYKLGQARLIAFILTCYLEKEYKSKDIKEYLTKGFMDTDEELKSMVFDCMKDF